MRSEIETTNNLNKEKINEQMEKRPHIDYESCKQFIFANQTLVPTSKMWEIYDIKC
jgi:hypothetical protein